MTSILCKSSLIQQYSVRYKYFQLKLTFCFLLILFTLKASAQNQKYKLEGILYEHNTTDPIAHATISVSNGQNIKSNNNGYYSVLLPLGTYQITITHLSYDTLFRSVKINKNLELPLYLKSRTSLINEVNVTGLERKNNVDKLSPNVQTLSKKDLDKVPAFLGQRDPLKALQTLPGIGKGGEGNSGFYVRGGTSGQNLTLFNDAVIYNPSHLLGFFSVFNSSAVDNVQLYKSGIPAEYGGRLSSIIEVNSSRKITDSLSAEIDVSILSATAKVDIPITPNWSVTASSRKTLMNYTVWPILNKLTSNSSLSDMKYDFIDFNLNLNGSIGRNNFLYFSAYSGGDDFGFNINRININNTMDWQNKAYSATWKKIISNAVVLNNTVSYSGYRFNFGMKQNEYEAGISSRIKDLNYKSNLNIYLNKHTIKTGIQYTDHNYTPNTPFLNSAGTEYDFGVPNTYYSDESSVFVSDEFQVLEKTGIYVGTRLTYYRHKGPFHIINEDKSEINYNKNSVISSAVYFEPSITLSHKITSGSSFKLSLSQNVQPVHLISTTAVNFPADFWMPSLKTLPPAKGSQVSAGYFRNFGSKYETYIDLYFKDMNGLTEFSGGIMNLIDNLKIEDNLLYGAGNAYGSEFFLKKKTGTLTGWVGYTLSKSSRNFELINNSKSFPAKYDRRHDLSVISNYAFSKKWSFSGSFTFATGNAFTKPTSRYLIGGNVVNEYGSFNGSRMPDYHRMDIAATYKLKRSLHTSSELSFSVYNLYNRQNPIYIYFLAEGNVEKQRISIQPKSVILLPILPSVNYKITFK